MISRRTLLQSILSIPLIGIKLKKKRRIFYANKSLYPMSYSTHYTPMTVSVNLGRESLLELGRKTPYFKPESI